MTFGYFIPIAPREMPFNPDIIESKRSRLQRRDQNDDQNVTRQKPSAK